MQTARGTIRGPLNTDSRERVNRDTSERRWLKSPVAPVSEAAVPRGVPRSSRGMPLWDAELGAYHAKVAENVGTGRRWRGCIACLCGW
jgi:hypothetical protein